MPPKSASTGKNKPLSDDEDVLQAVILADSFNNRFKPLTLNKPRCLLPICNAPLLDWAFESLALAGVQEIFVVCRSHAELVKAAIRNSRWSQPSSGIKIVPIITAKETFSPGDALRDIYTHGVITTDFVLISGDLVSNMRIDEVVQVHKERRKTNKNAIMTIVTKESGPRHRTRSRGDSSVFVLDAETSECLHYQAVIGQPPTTRLHIPREILKDHPEVEIRNDLVDCFIDVCSVEVPSLFQDNFDYQDIRRDFVHGVLTSDLLMKNIYCFVAKQGYAARVTDTRSFDAISKDILGRWTFPLVPDNYHPGGQSYEHLRGNKYIAKDNSVILSRTCKVSASVLIGAATRVCDNAEIISSVIGQRCTIGEGSVIRHAYLFDDVVVEPNCIVERCIVGAGVRIKRNSAVQTGCLVGDGVVLGPEAQLAPFERVSRRAEKRVHVVQTDGDDENEDDLGFDVDTALQPPEGTSLGADSNAIVWPRGATEEEEDPESVENFANLRLMRIGEEVSDLEVCDAGSASPSEGGGGDSSDDEEGEEDDNVKRHLGSFPVASSGASPPPLGDDAADGATESEGEARGEVEFRAEVQLSLRRAFSEEHAVENAAVELKTLRMASNVPLRRVREAVVAAIVEHIPIIVEGAGANASAGVAAQRKEIGRVVGRWGQLINKIGGINAVETVSVLQAHCASSERLPLFGQILAALYQDDIVEEDDIREWHAKPESRAAHLGDGSRADNMRKCWAIGGRMIQQFDEQESEEESD